MLDWQPKSTQIFQELEIRRVSHIYCTNSNCVTVTFVVLQLHCSTYRTSGPYPNTNELGNPTNHTTPPPTNELGRDSMISVFRGVRQLVDTDCVITFEYCSELLNHVLKIRSPGGINRLIQIDKAKLSVYFLSCKDFPIFWRVI